MSSPANYFHINASINGQYWLITNMVLVYHASLKKRACWAIKQMTKQLMDNQKRVSMLNIQCRRNPRFSGLFSVHCPEWCNWPSLLHHCYSWASLEPSSTSGNFCFWSERVLRSDSLMDNIYKPQNQSVLYLPFDGPKKSLQIISILNYIHKHHNIKEKPH